MVLFISRGNDFGPWGDTLSLTDTALGEKGAEVLVQHHPIRCKDWPLLGATWVLKIVCGYCKRKERAVTVPVP